MMRVYIGSHDGKDEWIEAPGPQSFIVNGTDKPVTLTIGRDGRIDVTSQDMPDSEPAALPVLDTEAG